MLVFKFDVLSKLKEKGYSTYKIRNEKLLGEATVQKLRRNQMIGIDGVDAICRMLQCQPGDFLEYKD